MKDHNLKDVFTGSMVEANFIKSILDENQIGSIIRDSISESVGAGWGSGSPESSSQIFVDESHEIEAKRLIAEFLNSKQA